MIITSRKKGNFVTINNLKLYQVIRRIAQMFRYVIRSVPQTGFESSPQLKLF